MLDRQMMFDDAAKHMAKQRSKAVDGNRCVYRTPDGRKCIIGAMIPDSKYERSFDDGDTIEQVVRTGLDSKYGQASGNLADTYFAVALRSLHDASSEGETWEHFRRQLFRAFERFAKDYGLDFRVARCALSRDEVVPKSSRIPAFTEENYEDFEPSYMPGEILGHSG